MTTIEQMWRTRWHEEMSQIARALNLTPEAIPEDDGRDAILVALARVRRDGAREALGSLQNFARECMDGERGEIDGETFAGWHHTWAAALQHCVTHYPETEG